MDISRHVNLGGGIKFIEWQEETWMKRLSKGTFRKPVILPQQLIWNLNHHPPFWTTFKTLGDIPLNPGCLIGIHHLENNPQYNWVGFHPLYTTIHHGELVPAQFEKEISSSNILVFRVIQVYLYDRILDPFSKDFRYQKWRNPHLYLYKYIYISCMDTAVL